MRQLKLVGLACLAVFALTAAMASSASALLLPEILPLIGNERTFTGENDGTAPELVSTEAGTHPIKCEAATATGTEEAKKPLGSYHITFTKCKTEEGGLQVPCNSEGDAKETILNLGGWHLVLDQETPELLTATLFLSETTKIVCGGIAKIEVKGSVLCLDLALLTGGKHYLFHCKEKAGVAEERTYLNAGDKEGTNGTAQLTCKKNAGLVVECAELALGLVLYSGTEALTVDA
jgi:hypothetical protein